MSAVASIILAVGSAVAGGIIQGKTAAEAIEKKTKAYKEAAKRMKAAADEYSGEKLYNKMREAGDRMAYDQAMMSERTFQGDQGPGQTNNLMNMAAQAADLAGQNANAAGVAGRQQGQQLEQGKNEALYNAEKTQVEQMLKQADTDYNAAMEAGKTAASGLGGMLSLAGNLGSGAVSAAKEYKAKKNA